VLDELTEAPQTQMEGALTAEQKEVGPLLREQGCRVALRPRHSGSRSVVVRLRLTMFLAILHLQIHTWTSSDVISLPSPLTPRSWTSCAA
jgi:hypothetical protein